jgi:putative DNA methylase
LLPSCIKHLADTARELCYRLYTICERKKRANKALSYNGLVQSFPELVRLAREGGPARKAVDRDLFDEGLGCEACKR